MRFLVECKEGVSSKYIIIFEESRFNCKLKNQKAKNENNSNHIKCHKNEQI